MWGRNATLKNLQLKNATKQQQNCSKNKSKKMFGLRSRLHFSTKKPTYKNAVKKLREQENVAQSSS